ncbi:hypothetical protein ACF3MZ_23310 [Paenibacillaceae bacterium WGS1546]|uniref:hypothetical protein n=1 Tax=Cohnella sp. WGS1546 TaxID=3366810 RepID=UPI00372D4A86
MEVHPLSAMRNSPGSIVPSVMAIGFFDGVHLAHRRVLERAKRIASQSGLPLSAMTFHPHPRQVIGSADETFSYITPPDEKMKRMRECGVEHLYWVEFDRSFAALSAEEYVRQYVVDNRVRHVVAGFDFKYGHRGEGDMNRLRAMGEGRFGVTVVPALSRWGEKISSTRIREWISCGEMELVPEYLGRAHETTGNVLAAAGGLLTVELADAFILPPPGRYEIDLYGECSGLLSASAELTADRMLAVRADAADDRRWMDRPARAVWKRRLP